MELFSTIVRKILYPRNTIAELRANYLGSQPQCATIFYECIKKDEKIIIYKNPKYNDHVFYLGNTILFYPEESMKLHCQKLTIYDSVFVKYRFLEKYTGTFMQKVNVDFLDFFKDVQKHYMAFAKLANIWRHKKCVVQIDHDLYMNNLNKNGRNVFSLLQQDKIYLFTSANLVSIICSALSNASDFFANPLAIKNPYNNVPLTKSDLYNIYFFLKQTPIIMPILFHNFFVVDFDLKKFVEENENIIKHIAIHSYVRNASSSILYYSAIKMLKKYQKNIVIHTDFPKDLLINILRPYLFLYYIIKYSSEEHRVYDALKNIKYKLNKLYVYNPRFGRKIVKLKRVGFSKKMTKTIMFHSEHPIFDNVLPSIQAYQTTHLEIIHTDTEIPTHQTYYESPQINTNHRYFVVDPPVPSFSMYNTLTITSQYGYYHYESEDNAEEYNSEYENSESDNEREYQDEDDETVIESEHSDYEEGEGE